MSPVAGLLDRFRGKARLSEQWQRLAPHLWVALALTAIGLASFVAVDQGNLFGIDEWGYIYAVSRGSAEYATNRPLTLLPWLLAYHAVGPHPLAVQGVYLLLRISNAFLIYLLVRRFSPRNTLFAVACGGLYLTFLIDDWFFLQSQAALNIMGIVFFTLLALYLYFLYASRRSYPALLLSLPFAFAAVWGYEAAVPLLIGVPVLVFLIERDFSPARLAGLGVWLAVIVASSVRYVSPLLDRTGTYGSSLLVDLNPLRMARDGLRQFVFVYKDLLLAEPARLFPYRLPAIISAGVLLIALAILHAGTGGREEPPAEWRRYALWLAAGVVVTWLGFAAFLPTGLIRAIERIHPFSAAGEAITLSAAIWLAGSPLRTRPRHMWALRYAAVGFVAAFGAAQTGYLQDDLYFWQATWETQSYYLRSLAHLVPDVEEDTLFVYLEDPDLPQVPFVSGWAFQFAVRYLYDDAANGLVTRDTLFLHDWEIRDDGVEITPQPAPSLSRFVGAGHYYYTWDQIIVVSKTPDGRAFIFDELPPELYAPRRAALYDPYARIRAGPFVPERVRRPLPPIQNPDYPPFAGD